MIASFSEVNTKTTVNGNTKVICINLCQGLALVL